MIPNTVIYLLPSFSFKNCFLHFLILSTGWHHIFLNSTIIATYVKQPEMFKSKWVPDTMPQKLTKLNRAWILG